MRVAMNATSGMGVGMWESGWEGGECGDSEWKCVESGWECQNLNGNQQKAGN